jgi:hypothetical protein
VGFDAPTVLCGSIDGNNLLYGAQNDITIPYILAK